MRAEAKARCAQSEEWRRQREGEAVRATGACVSGEYSTARRRGAPNPCQYDYDITTPMPAPAAIASARASPACGGHGALADLQRMERQGGTEQPYPQHAPHLPFPFRSASCPLNEKMVQPPLASRTASLDSLRTSPNPHSTEFDSVYQSARTTPTSAISPSKGTSAPNAHSPVTPEPDRRGVAPPTSPHSGRPSPACAPVAATCSRTSSFNRCCQPSELGYPNSPLAHRATAPQPPEGHDPRHVRGARLERRYMPSPPDAAVARLPSA